MTHVKEVTAPEDKIPILKIAYQGGVDSGNAAKAISFETYVPQDVPVEALNSILDRMGEALTRQTAIYERKLLVRHIKNAKADIPIVEEQIAKIQRRRADMDTAARANGRRKGPVIAGEEESLRQCLDKIEVNKMKIKHLLTEVEEFDEIINGGSTPSSTDSQSSG